jgi:hypothetical protein
MKTHTLINFIIFTCFLVVGYRSSTRFSQADYGILPRSMSLVTSSDSGSFEVMKNGQRTILLITVSSLDKTKPQLESVWLATYFPSDATIRLLPVFPSGNNPKSNFEGQLDHSFGLNRMNNQLVLRQEFVKVLENNNYWWSGYFIFDDGALTKIFNLLGGLELNGRSVSGEQAMLELPKVVDDPLKAFSSQMAILQSACHKLAGISIKPDWSQVSVLIPTHILTDLDSNQIVSELKTLNSSGHNPTCKFPTLEISQFDH